MTESTAALIVATLAFVGGHFLLSHPLRAPLVRLVGEKLFPAVYSALVIAAFVWMLYAFGAASRFELWGKAEWMRWPLIILMLPACILLVAGLTAPNPLIVGREKVLASEGVARGIFAVTRHPANWAFAIWGIGHLIMNGDSATVILAGGIAFLAIFGSLAQEQRKEKALGEAWRRFAAATSFVPFVAIGQGRATLSARDIGYWRIAGGVVLWAVLMHAHRYIVSVSPFGG